ncbi:Hypothetical_protein [Hexamita inflata]|uniref:Hypothetical_protein n=1 Tax=Hexamita inflata TaxID=28002 RepID=A0AA86NM90_9EUKA|nr:Hypothetical protein HINF_LOCUS9469 [Hexamita inflata]
MLQWVQTIRFYVVSAQDTPTLPNSKVTTSEYPYWYSLLFKQCGYCYYCGNTQRLLRHSSNIQMCYIDDLPVLRHFHEQYKNTLLEVILQSNPVQSGQQSSKL